MHVIQSQAQGYVISVFQKKLVFDIGKDEVGLDDCSSAGFAEEGFKVGSTFGVDAEFAEPALPLIPYVDGLQ